MHTGREKKGHDRVNLLRAFIILICCIKILLHFDVLYIACQHSDMREYLKLDDDDDLGLVCGTKTVSTLE